MKNKSSLTPIEEYISSYAPEFTFTQTETYDYEVLGVKVHVDVYEFSDERDHREKAHVLLSKNGLTCEFDCIESNRYDNMFCPVTLNGKTFLCHRKTLYGFSLLDPDSFVEYEYFPEKVMRGEESFIISSAVSFGDIIIFEGCYWAAPYIAFAYDHKNNKFLDLSEEYGFFSSDSVEVADELLLIDTFNDKDESLKIRIEYKELCRCILEKVKFYF